MNGKILDPIGMHLGLALDSMTLLQAIKLSANTSGKVAILKANDLALDRGSKDVVEVLSALIPEKGGIWIDSKSFDTDGTMNSTTTKIGGNGARIMSVHLLNSRNALLSAQKAADSNACFLTGITILTSYTEEEVLEIFHRSLSELVPWLTERGKDLGFKSVVCSATQLPGLIEKGLLKGMVPIIPGTRSMTTIDISNLNPQAQTDSTENVFKILAENNMQGIVVLGSEVTKAKNQVQKLAEIKASIQKMLDENGLELLPKIPLLEA
ncbi:MAG: orotidine 5'-phosphate decarboxylase / HUMPS family protein [Minisyncoccia bacterium]